MVERVQVFSSREVAISRLNGVPRSADGRHRRLVAYCAADVSTAELVRLLRDAAERLARSLPKVSDD